MGLGNLEIPEESVELLETVRSTPDDWCYIMRFALLRSKALDYLFFIAVLFRFLNFVSNSAGWIHHSVSD